MTAKTMGEHLEATIKRHTDAAQSIRDANQAKRDSERAAYLTGQPERLAALDALLSPIEAVAAAIDDGLEKFADEREEKAKAARKRRDTLYVTPDDGEFPRDWGGIRAHPEVAPLIAQGYKLTSVMPDFAGRRVAELTRERAT